MKIGIDCRFYSEKFTGIGRYTFELVKHYLEENSKKEKPDQYVLFFNKPEFTKFKFQDPNVKTVNVASKHYSLAEQTRFLKILNKENLDIVHFTHFNVPIFYRRPFIVTIHDLTLSFHPGQKMNRFYHRLAYNWTIKNAVKKAKKIIAISENTKKDIVNHLKIAEEKIKVIHNGVGENFCILQDQTRLKKTLEKYKITKQFLLYTGVWRSHKNLPRLIEAFDLIKERDSFDLQLVLTGNNQSHYPEVIEKIKSSKFSSDIITPGLVTEDELVDLYNAADIYIFPSLYEGFGLPPLEAMKSGTAVIAANSSSIPEVCADCALYFNPYDAFALADQIKILYCDPALKSSLIEKGLNHVQKFQWSLTGKESYKILTDK